MRQQGVYYCGAASLNTRQMTARGNGNADSTHAFPYLSRVQRCQKDSPPSENTCVVLYVNPWILLHKFKKHNEKSIMEHVNIPSLESLEQYPDLWEIYTRILNKVITQSEELQYATLTEADLADITNYDDIINALASSTLRQKGISSSLLGMVIKTTNSENNPVVYATVPQYIIDLYKKKAN